MITEPTPGHIADDLRPYGQYCPITRALEVLGERWTLLIVRDMICGATRFNEISRGNPGLSRTLLAKRLRQLGRAGIVEHVGDEYHLTPMGAGLRPLIDELADWGARYQFGDPQEHELDAELLMWWVHDRLDLDAIGGTRLVLEFHFRDRGERVWLLHDRDETSVCTHDPGFGIDATIATDLATMYQVWLGRVDLRAALRSGEVDVHGRRDVVRRLPSMLELSPVAAVVARYR